MERIKRIILVIINLILNDNTYKNKINITNILNINFFNKEM